MASSGVHVFDIAKDFINAKKSLGLYFDHKYDTCFCKPCHSKRGDNLTYLRGNPPKAYGLPIGWCKFGLKTKPQAEVKDIFKNWHVAFHGTSAENVEKILSSGEFLLPGDVTPSGKELEIPKNHWDPKNPKMKPPKGHDVNMFYFSPSIRYAGCEVYAKKHRWRNPRTGKEHDLRVAFQVRIEPGTYETGPQTIGAENDIDHLFDNNELEWFTKRRGVSILVGLLVKVEGLVPEIPLQELKDIFDKELVLHQAASRFPTGDKLLFSKTCGAEANVINGQCSARRLSYCHKILENVNETFWNALVLTDRVLHTGKLFEVTLHEKIKEWNGCLRIGVTTHSPITLEFPDSMSDFKSDVWMMNKKQVKYGDQCLIEEYGQNIDKLNVGEKVGVVRKDGGALHFFVNGVDQGEAARNVPAEVYGIVDIFASAVQVTIVDHTEIFEKKMQLKFDFVHVTGDGREILLKKGGKCTVMGTEGDITTVVHPTVNEPVKIPNHYLTLYIIHE